MAKRELSMTYRAVHQRIAAKRGLARAHRCVAPDCEEQAQVWAWQRTGPFIQVDPTPQLQARQWGTQIEDYEPMCSVHATRLDRGGTLTHCPAGHLRTPENIYQYPSGAQECRECMREGRRARRALRVRKACEICGVEITEQNLARHRTKMHEKGESR